MQAEEAKKIVRAYYERLYVEHDLSVYEELISPDFIDHDFAPGTPPGPESAARLVGAFRNEYPDLHGEILDIIAEENKVALRILWTGINWRSGEKLNSMAVSLIYVSDDGKIIERWSAYG